MLAHRHVTSVDVDAYLTTAAAERLAGIGGAAPTVHQSGPRRLWDILDDLRYRWLREGSLPVYGATVTIAPDGVCHLRRGRWQATIPQSG
ncbi:MAG: hypothetical protein ACRDY5_08895 [Acidimicrobiales bacterium]